ncbi:MAG: glycosyltransferase [Elusimicrobiales bacterium]
MTRPVFSVVCVYNDAETLAGWALKGLKEQALGFEPILVDNTGGAFRSAAEGLNHGGAKAGGEYIVFMHQDVRLLSADWLRRAEVLLRALPDLGAAGVAGMTKGGSGGLFRVGAFPLENRAVFVYQGPEKERLESGINSSAPVAVQTLDEQLLIIPAKVFSAAGFDAATCAGWHLYGVDYSLSVKKLGLKAYALPLPVWHRSTGTLNREYYGTLNKVIKKHKEEKVLYTTCGLWRTSVFLNLADLFLSAVRGQLGRWAGRNKSGAGPFINRIKMFLGAGGA